MKGETAEIIEYVFGLGYADFHFSSLHCNLEILHISTQCGLQTECIMTPIAILEEPYQ